MVGLTEGERWTVELLDELRAGGYRPRAWQRFLARSFERARETRARRPGLDRQATRWAAAWGTAALAARRWRMLPQVPAASEAAWWLGAAAMLRWHLGMVEGPRGESRRGLSAADALALGRAWLAPRIRRADSRASFLSLLVLGSASDVADGVLARRLGESRLGRDLDSLADVAFYAAAARRARDAGWIRPGAARTVTLRLSLGVALGTLRYFARSEAPPRGLAELGHWAAPPTVAGLAIAPLGRPRASAALLALGAAASVAAQSARSKSGSVSDRPASP
jgi:phosphatidylglycerophosphate synthase